MFILRWFRWQTIDLFRWFRKHNATIARWGGIVLGIMGLIGLYFSYTSLHNDLNQSILTNSPRFNQPISLMANGKSLIVANVSHAVIYLPYSIQYRDVHDGTSWIYNISNDGPVEVEVNGRVVFGVPEKFIKNDGLVETKLCYAFDSNPFKYKKLSKDIRQKLGAYFHSTYPADWFQRNEIVRQAYPEASCSFFILAISDGNIEEVY